MPQGFFVFRVRQSLADLAVEATPVRGRFFRRTMYSLAPELLVTYRLSRRPALPIIVTLLGRELSPIIWLVSGRYPASRHERDS